MMDGMRERATVGKCGVLEVKSSRIGTKGSIF
jgi:hypothetical protein